MNFPTCKFLGYNRGLLRFLPAFFYSLVFLMGPGNTASLAETSTRIITDSSGRQVVIPTEIYRVISTCPTTTTLVYMLAPEKLMGWNFKADTRNMPPKYAALPVVGGWFGLWSGNYETMINMHPDVLLYETLIDNPNGGSLEILHDRQRKFGAIPVVGIFGSGDMPYLDDVILLMGDILNVRKKARQLVDYHGDIMRMVSDRVAGIPREDRIRVYYAERPDGLSTDPSGSRHSALISMCGGINVADCPLKQGMGLSRVSMEQVLQWNPQVIITEKGHILNAIRKNPLWAGIEAVRKKRVYLTPRGPFCWFDRPPGASTILGILWTAMKLYPDRFRDIDLRDHARRFYNDFYHYRLTDVELDRLLGSSQNIRKKKGS